VKVITLHPDAFKQSCIELCKQIEVKPDVVIGIKDGGLHVQRVIEASEIFEDTTFVSLQIDKPDNKKSTKQKLAPLLKRLPKFIVNKLRVLEMKKRGKTIKGIESEQLYSKTITLEALNIENPNHILIVDDALDSGKTMTIAHTNIAKRFPDAQIKTAVITWTLEQAIFQPDYFKFKNVLCRFPWSFDYEA